jgi:hypothetical protein
MILKLPFGSSNHVASTFGKFAGDAVDQRAFGVKSKQLFG